jgi:acetyl-CoA carboxylase biotin carboxyl carrier protein
MAQIKAHITGTVWKIEVAAGDTIDEDAVVMILESMKMEMPVESNWAGRIVELHVKEGEAVAEGQLLATIEPD